MKWYEFNIKNLTDGEFNYWYSHMAQSKQERVNKFRFTDDKKRSVAGEMLVRKAISERCNVAPENILISTKENGKPFTPHLNIEFNISHSGDMVVCAIDEKNVGIDIEKIRPIDLKIAKKIFNDEELFYIFTRTPCEADFKFTENTDILTRFFKIWTKKEAHGKFTGQGIFAQSPLSNCNTEYFEAEENYIICICTEK